MHAKELHAKGPHTTVSNPCFHTKIIEKYSSGKKKFFSFPFLLFRKGYGEEPVRENRFSFPIHFHFLRYIVSQEIISPEFPEKRGITKNQLLQFPPLKKGDVCRIHKKASNTQNLIRQNIRDIIQRKEAVTQKVVYNVQKEISVQKEINVQKEIHTSSRSDSFYPVSGSLVSDSLTAVNTLHKKTSDTIHKKTPHKKTPDESLLHSSIVTRLAENSVFYPSVFHPGKKSRKRINQIYSENEISGESFRTPFPARRRAWNLNRVFLKNVVSGKNLPDENFVYESVSALNSIPFSGLKVSLKSYLTMPSGFAFDSGLVLDSSSGKEAYRQVPGLVFSSAGSLSKELEREIESIKKELTQTEKDARASYSSIYSKMEEELKRNLEINRISEQVIQQITMRLKIEKERRGLL